MALHCTKLFFLLRTRNLIQRAKATTVAFTENQIKINKPVQYKTENNIVYLEDPDVFGTLSRSASVREDVFEEEGDIKEQEFISNLPLKSQKFTTKQYADLIKQYISLQRIKEAIDVLEIRMLSVDRVKPENYLYNILIGACANVGYTKKAFQLYNDMKRRGLKPTGDTYTCLFNACANSPWKADGLKRAHHLRNFMVEKGIEPNLTNFNAIIKAFGQCGDLPTAFQVVDEMVSKKIKIRVHTFNHLLHACISDKNTGLRHALVVWRKMLRMREKPNLYSFNLMLKCVKDCNLGTKQDIEELISFLSQNLIEMKKTNLQIEDYSNIEQKNKELTNITSDNTSEPKILNSLNEGQGTTTDNTPIPFQNDLEIVDLKKLEETRNKKLDRSVPNLLSKVIQMQHVLALQEVHELRDKFAVVGGEEDFLKEMEAYSVKPDIKTFTQMLPLLSGSQKSEQKLLETMKSLNIRADIDFYNNLIKTRCFRADYDGAFAVRNMILEENKINKKKHPLKKKLQIKFNVMTYGVLALACRTKESAEKLIEEMREEQLKLNIEILGTLLKNGTIQCQFDYILYIMRLTKEDNIKVNSLFLKHLEVFSDICSKKLKQMSGKGNLEDTNEFKKSFKSFSKLYKEWLADINFEKTLESEHPWQQFKENYPETIQRTGVEIKEPRKFYKRNRKFVPYTPRL